MTTSDPLNERSHALEFFLERWGHRQPKEHLLRLCSVEPMEQTRVRRRILGSICIHALALLGCMYVFAHEPHITRGISATCTRQWHQVVAIAGALVSTAALGRWHRRPILVWFLLAIEAGALSFFVALFDLTQDQSILLPVATGTTAGLLASAPLMERTSSWGMLGLWMSIVTVPVAAGSCLRCTSIDRLMAMAFTAVMTYCCSYELHRLGGLVLVSEQHVAAILFHVDLVILVLGVPVGSVIAFISAIVGCLLGMALTPLVDVVTSCLGALRGRRVRPVDDASATIVPASGGDGRD